jgi:hypothetical protein
MALPRMAAREATCITTGRKSKRTFECFMPDALEWEIKHGRKTICRDGKLDGQET